MATTNFTTGTVIASDWLNEVDAHVFDQDATTHTSDHISYTPAGTGAIVASVQDKLREQISVKDFGALGDGTTDDTAAIQRAVTYAATLTGTINLRGTGVAIYFPAGSYLVTSSITVTVHGLAFIGEEGKGTEIKGDCVLFDVGDYTLTRRVRGTTFSNLNFGATNTANATAAIKLYRTSGTKITACYFNDFSISIDCYRASTSHIASNSFHNQTRTAQATAFIRMQGTDETATTLETYTPGGGCHVTDCEFQGKVTGGGGVGLYDTTAGISLLSVDGFYMTQSHFTGCVYSVHVNPDATAANHTTVDIMLSNCYFDEPSEINTSPRNMYVTGTVKESISMADASTQSSTYQSIRSTNCYYRGSSYALRNFEVAVTDGDTWWDLKQLKDILLSGNTFRQSERQSIYMFPSSSGYIEPYGVVIDGNFFEEGNSTGTSGEGAAIHVNVESAVITNNVIDTPAGTSDYGILVNATDVGNDQPNPSVIVQGNDVSYGTYGIEPVRVSVAATSVGAKTIQADNIYSGAGRVVRQQYKVTTTDATSTPIWTYVIPSAVAGTVTVKITGSNSTGAKAIAGEWRAGFRNNGAASSLSTGTANFTAVHTCWNPDGIATIPTATLAVNTLTATVTGVAAETWTWSCVVTLEACK